jgi:hypothetical protein
MRMVGSNYEQARAAATGIVDTAAPAIARSFTDRARHQLTYGYPDDAVDYVLLGLLDADTPISKALHTDLTGYIAGARPDDPEFAERLAGHLQKVTVRAAA